MRHLLIGQGSAGVSRGLTVLTLLALVFGSLLAGSGFGASPARADVPDPPASTPFNAPLCVGTTTEDPTDDVGPVPDLTLVFGQRLVEYNAGQSVILYGYTGETGKVPACAVHYEAGVGPVSDWVYCTDYHSNGCAHTLEDGSLAAYDFAVPGLQDVQGNSRLTSEEERIIAYILQNDIPVDTPVGVASDMTTESRVARASLVWCISDPDVEPEFCASNMTPEDRARILSLTPLQAALTVTPRADETDLAVGQTAHFDLTTNVFGQPIQLAVEGGEVEVCEGEATLSGENLTVAGEDAASATTVVLCVTAESPGTVSLSAVAAISSHEQISWVQSPGTDTIVCQVISIFRSTAPSSISASGAVTFVEVAATGGFDVQKLFTGPASDRVPEGTQFTVKYTVDGGAPQTLQVGADGQPVSVDALPEGAIVEFDEIDLPEIDGVAWGTPSFVIGGLPSKELVIAADQTSSVVLTNAANKASTTSPSSPSSPSKPDRDTVLANTGSESLWNLGSIVLLLFAAGIFTTALARRASQGQNA